MMIINSLHIHGFGKWQNKQIDFKGEQMVTIIGDNEAGKSTMRQFIIFMLFGFPPSERKRYLPKQGGQLGGKLIITGDDGRNYTIERFHDRHNGEAICYDAGGHQLPAAWLTNELSGIDRALYEKIFHFDVLSLQMKEGLSEEALGEVLLSVGMTGSDRIYQTEKQLNSFLQDTFKPTGRVPKLNKQLTKLTDKEKELKKYENSIEIYEALKQEKLADEIELKETKRVLDRLNEQLAHLKEQQRIYPVIESYHLSLEALDELPAEIDFPEQGEERYRQLKELLDPLQREVEINEYQLSSLNEDLEKIEDKLYTESDQALIKARIDQIEMYQGYIDQKKQLEHQYEQKDQAIHHAFSQLKLDLDEDEIARFPINYTIGDTWRNLAEQTEKTNSERDQVDQSLYHLEQTGGELEAKSQALKEKVLSHQEKDLLSEELGQIDRVMNEQSSHHDRPLKNWQKQNRLFMILSIVLLGTVIILPSENSLIHGLTLVAFLIISALFFMNQIRSKETFQSDSLGGKNHELKEWFIRKEQIVKRLAEHEEHRDTFLIVEQERKKNSKDQAQLSETYRLLMSEIDRIKDKRTEQATIFPFLKKLSVEYWPDLAQRLLNILDLIEERAQLKGQLADEFNRIEAFEQETLAQLNHILTETNLPFSQQLYKLQEIAIEQQNRLTQQEKLAERIDQKLTKINQIKAELSPYQDERDQLFKRVNVDTDEKFIKLAQKFKKWRELKDKQGEAQRQIKLHLPDEIVSEILSGNFLTIGELEAELAIQNEEADRLYEAINQLSKKIAEQKAVLDQSAQSSKIVNLKHDYYLMKERFQEESREWLVHQIAVKHIEKTKAIFQSSYLPGVLEQAANFIAQITDNRYNKLAFDQEDQQLFLVTNAGEPYQISELSQGTLDQLFVALRLAVSHWLSKHISLPFLIDDGFVHFDDARQRKMNEILLELKEVHQVIYFTKSNPGFQDQYVKSL